jgi:hypothetical protein
MRHVILTYSATTLASQTSPDDGSVQPKHAVRKKGDQVISRI